MNAVRDSGKDLRFCFLQGQSGSVFVRSTSAGEVPAETVSVPLRGRRQLYLQQGELLNASGGQPEKPREEDGKAAAKVKERDGPMRRDECGQFGLHALHRGPLLTADVLQRKKKKKKAIVAQRKRGKNPRRGLPISFCFLSLQHAQLCCFQNLSSHFISLCWTW